MAEQIPEDVLAERISADELMDLPFTQGRGPGPMIPEDVLAEQDATARSLQEASLRGTDAQPVDLEES